MILSDLRIALKKSNRSFNSDGVKTNRHNGISRHAFTAFSFRPPDFSNFTDFTTKTLSLRLET